MKITNHIHQLRIEFEIPIAPDKSIDRFVHAFLIVGHKIHLVDSGVSDAYPAIESYIKQIGRDISEVENLLLTHSHPDHIGAAKPISELSNCHISAHAAEVMMIEDVDFQCSVRPVPGFQKLVAGSVPVDHVISDGDEIKLEENLTIRVLHTPGHSAGSVSYYLVEENVLFTGDAILLPGEIPIFDDPLIYFKSLEKIEQQNVECLLSAWDGPRLTDSIPDLLFKSREYISIIRNAAKKVASKSTDRELKFCLEVLSELGLPSVLANPLLTNSFLSCLN